MEKKNRERVIKGKKKIRENKKNKNKKVGITKKRQ